MLKSSLMGDGLVSMVANVHPGRLHFEDSNNTLEYAKRASTVKAMNRRMSRQSFGYVEDFTPSLRVMPGHNDIEEHEDPVVSIPGHRTTRGQQSTQVCSKGRRVTQSCEITTASSPEECLSEISLSSGHDPSVAEDLGSPSEPGQVSPTAGTPEEELEDQPEDLCDDKPPKVFLGTETLMEIQADEVGPSQDKPEELLAAVELAEKLQKQNQRLDARLRSVTRERNGLLKERQTLEDENERLRQENMEKDRQLLALLSRCEPAVHSL
jgi:hypothetical protein